MTPLASPLLALAAAMVLGTSDFLGGVLSKRHHVAVVIGWSHVVSCVVLFVIGLAAGCPSTLAWLPWAVGAGVCSGLGLLTFYAALASGTMGVVAPLAAIGVVVPLLAAVVEGERPSLVQASGTALALVGAVLASGPELRSGEKVRARAVWLAVVSGVAFGVMTIGIVHGARDSNLWTMVGMRMTSSTAFVLAAAGARTLGHVRFREVVAIGSQGLLDVSGNLLLGAASTLGMVSIVVVITALYPVATIALAAVFLHERLRGVQAWGVVLALVGVVLMNLRS